MAKTTTDRVRLTPDQRYLLESRVGVYDGLVHLAYAVNSPSVECNAWCLARCKGWQCEPDAVVTCLRCAKVD